jgi:hypothetical protein
MAAPAAPDDIIVNLPGPLRSVNLPDLVLDTGHLIVFSGLMTGAASVNVPCRKLITVVI